MIDRAFARVLKDLRAQSGLSQEALGDRTDLHRTYISQLERGLKSPSLRTIERLCSALGVGLSDMMAAVEGEMVSASASEVVTDAAAVPDGRTERAR